MEVSTAGAEQMSLAERLNELHQLLYTRGGVRPSNAAVEELTKLLLIRIASSRHPNLKVGDQPLRELLDPAAVRSMEGPRPLKEAFAAVNVLPDLSGWLPDGRTQAVWPEDEPLRISRVDVLAEAISIVCSIPLGEGRAIDAVGTAFDVFLRGRYEHAGGLGTYLTPESVVRAMAQIGFDLIGDLGLRPEGGTVMGDPCCGSGRFLVGMLEEAARRDPTVEREALGHAVFGADQSAASVAMARVNLLAYGLSHPKVFRAQDSVTDTSIDQLEGKLSLVLTNPPFGDGKYDSRDGILRAARVFELLSAKTRIDPSLAFVARCLSLLAPGGVAGIILPDGVGDGPYMRDLLLDRGRLFGQSVVLEGVVSLPSATFAPAGTTAKTSIVFLRNGNSTKGRAFFARADHVGHVMRKGRVTVDPDGDDLPTISDAVSKLLGGARSKSHANVALMDRDGLTTIDASSLDPDSLEARRSLLADGGSEFDSVLTVAPKRRAEVDDATPFVSVLHVDDLGNVDWIDAEHYRPTTPGVLAHGGQLIVSLLNPAKFRATVIPEALPMIKCSAEFGVFDSLIDPYAALALLQHPLVRAQIAPLGRGTSSSRRRIDADEVIRMVAPRYDDDWIAKAGREVRDALEAVADARARLTAAYCC